MNKEKSIFNMLSLSDLLDEESDFLPLLRNEDEKSIEKEITPSILPILPLRNTVLFPGVIIPITIGRDRSIRLIKDAYKGDKIIGVIAQKDANVDEPEAQDLHKIGTIAHVLKMLKMPDGNIMAIIQGRRRFSVEEYVQNKPYLTAVINKLEEKRPEKNDKEFKALVDSIKDLALRIVEESPNVPTEASITIKNIESSAFAINFVASNMNVSLTEKQGLLEEMDQKIRAKMTLAFLSKELQMLEMKNEIQSKVRTDLDKQQREFFLHQQMKAIQEELGGVGSEQEIDELRKKASKKKWKREIGELFDKELKKLLRMNSSMADYTVQRNYLELLIDLPWQDYSKDRFELVRAKKILDRDHFGMEKIKERILEFLAVLKIRNDMKSPILCLYGPPGVGKTSLGKSIAESLGRKYVRVALGGLRDEAEIRGHRKTYIGAMPGRIIKSVQKAGTSNPVFVLDEIDKVSADVHGDPSSALLEVLDPEQNENFYDNYLEVGYDLSKVLFIATANSLSSIQPALLDRMEIVEMNGYTVEEKIAIAKTHLLPKQLKEHGLSKKDLQLSSKVLEKIVEGYTRESGVRGLEKVISKLIRHAAKCIVMEQKYATNLHVSDLETILGPAKYDRDRMLTDDVVGVATGLAWTRVGGDILFVESSMSEGKGQLSITGNLGTVMKESATIGMEYLKAHAKEYQIDPKKIQESNVHIHVPEGATPKDGPSAGITIFTAMVSLFTGRKVRNHLAMTGEITLRGKVLPVGGIKEKILAAKRSGIKEIILCKENLKDVEEINSSYLKGLEFHYITNMKEVTNIALQKK